MDRCPAGIPHQFPDGRPLAGRQFFAKDPAIIRRGRISEGEGFLLREIRITPKPDLELYVAVVQPKDGRGRGCGPVVVRQLGIPHGLRSPNEEGRNATLHLRFGFIG